MAKLYQVVRQHVNADQKIFKLKHGEDVIFKESATDTLYSTIFDGIQLKVSINSNKWSLNVLFPQRSAMINVPEVCIACMNPLCMTLMHIHIVSSYMQFAICMAAFSRMCACMDVHTLSYSYNYLIYAICCDCAI